MVKMQGYLFTPKSRKSKSGVVKPEPPNFERGWKRTKETPLENPKGCVIMDY